MKKLTTLSVLLISLAFVVPVQVSAATNAGVKPGSFFYFFDTAFENIGLFFTFDSESKAKKALGYADERLAEIEAIAEEKNPDGVKTAIANYESNIALATEKSKEVKDKGQAETLLNSIADNNSRNQDVLATILIKVPDEAKEAITQAIEASKKGQEEATKQIAELKGEVERFQTPTRSNGPQAVATANATPKLYKNTILGFSFVYPADWGLRENKFEPSNSGAILYLIPSDLPEFGGAGRVYIFSASTSSDFLKHFSNLDSSIKNIKADDLNCDNAVQIIDFYFELKCKESRTDSGLSYTLTHQPSEMFGTFSFYVKIQDKIIIFRFETMSLKYGRKLADELDKVIRSIKLATTTSFNRDCVPTRPSDGVTKLNEYWAIKNSVNGIEYGSLSDERFCPLGVSTRNTFKILGSIYAEDEKNIYRFDYDPYSGSRAEMLDGADHDSFTVINDSFARDNRRVYFSGFGDTLSGSDTRYFEALSDRYAKDNRGVYAVLCYEGCTLTKIDADPKTFRVINDLYTADKDHLYCYGKEYEWQKSAIFIIEGIDSATFVSDPSIKWNIDYGSRPDAHDKYNEYKKCKKYAPER